MSFDFFKKKLKMPPRKYPIALPTPTKDDPPEPGGQDHITPVLKTPLDDLNPKKKGKR